jgi:leader peptidase (prepilin peptidase)/N-methyltransferase
MGFGDVKLAGLLGLVLGWAGWAPLVLGAFLGFLFGGVYSLALIGARRATRRSRVPFGPFMVAGALTAVCLGQSQAAGYLGLL